MLTSALLRPVISDAERPPSENATQVASGRPEGPVRRRGKECSQTRRVRLLQGHPFGGASRPARSAPISASYPPSLSSPGPGVWCGIRNSLGASSVRGSGVRFGFVQLLLGPAPRTRTLLDRATTGAGSVPVDRSPACSAGGASGFQNQVASQAPGLWNFLL